MPQLTVIQPGKVVRVQAKSIQALTRSLKAAGQRWLGIHEDLEPTIENLAAKVNNRASQALYLLTPSNPTDDN